MLAASLNAFFVHLSDLLLRRKLYMLLLDVKFC